ncbi:hypothetical protein GCM10028807_49870 [Spirosoma daeguense]
MFERDIIDVFERFPKLRLIHTATNKWVIGGELDICDMKGNYWDTFKIEITVPNNYPFCIPVVKEISYKIPREIDWHISLSGECCLDITHTLMYQARLGIGLSNFILTKVYPYFSNQLYKMQTGSYAGSEYAHSCEGVIQFYREELMLEPTHALVVLERLLKRIPFARNENCVCGKTVKVKNCHLSAINFLKSIDIKQLSIDLQCFRNL